LKDGFGVPQIQKSNTQKEKENKQKPYPSSLEDYFKNVPAKIFINKKGIFGGVGHGYFNR
jgi:hypothetical protein